MAKHSCKFQPSDFTLACRGITKEGCVLYCTFHFICLPHPHLLIGITEKYLFQNWAGPKTLPAMTIKQSQEEVLTCWDKLKNIDMNKTTFLLEINKMYEHNWAGVE